MPISFHHLCTVRLPNRRHLKLFVSQIFTIENKQLDTLSIIFCDDAYLLAINQTYLNHDDYTDIITFNLSTTNSTPIVGEIYISVERVKENAELLKVSFTQELHRVIFHGTLHLCGFNDKTKVQKQAMRKMEDKYLALYFNSLKTL